MQGEGQQPEQGSDAIADDPKGLIRESYRIDGITEAECRSILIDWTLSLPPGQDEVAALARLHARRAPGAADHPMTRLMAAAMTGPAATPRRRGGRAARVPQDQDGTNPVRDSAD